MATRDSLEVQFQVRVLVPELGEATEQTTKVETQQTRAVLSLPGRSEASRELFCTSLRACKHCIFQLSALL